MKKSSILILLLMSKEVVSFSQLTPKEVDLFEAVKANNLKKCKRYFSTLGAAADVLDFHHQTPLHVACSLGYLEVCELLLEKGAQIEAKNGLGSTPLHEASGSGYVEVCKLLLEKGAQIEAKNGFGSTPLSLACETIKHLTCGAFENICKRKVEVCKLLLDKGSQLEAKDMVLGWTPLHVACESGFVDGCKLLLDKKANIGAQDKVGDTPLHLACGGGYNYVCKCKVEVSRLLLDKEAKIEVQNKKGLTPLHVACKKGNAALCTLLLKKGSEINARTHKSETPLMLVCKEGNMGTIRMLLADKRLKKELKDDVLEGTALHWACKNNHFELCTELLRAGFSANETANTLSLLHLAVKTGNLQLVELFLEKQSDSNKADKNGMTALHLSCELGFDSITEELLLRKDQYGIKINSESLTKKIPLHNAVEANQVGSVRLLLKYGAFPNEVDSFNKTPLMYAAERRYLEICRLIKDKLPVSQFNEMKKFLGSLVRGHKELEELFGVRYESVPVLLGSVQVERVEDQKTGTGFNPIGFIDEQEQESELGEDIVDQVSDDEEDSE